MKIVFDSFSKYDAGIFSYDQCRNIIGGSWIYLLAKHAQENNMQLILADAYLAEGDYSAHDVFISEGVTRNTNRLLSTVAVPFMIYSGESPNVDWKFYIRIGKHSKPYTYAMLFPGLKSYVHQTTKFIPFYWPNDPNNEIPDTVLRIIPPRANKIVMIASNRKQNSSRSESVAKSFIKKYGMKLFSRIIPSLKLVDLYVVRMEAIKYFSKTGYLDLYGKNWENWTGLSDAEKTAITRLNPREVSNKYTLLTRYRFALCFENCIYPGYITEKIFDCFFARCIPIYYGAPDIKDYIPKNTFIDFRDFHDFAELKGRLTSMSEKEYNSYIQNINKYICSKEFERFIDSTFAAKVISLLS